jgi:hypothetical protein
MRRAISLTVAVLCAVVVFMRSRTTVSTPRADRSTPTAPAPAAPSTPSNPAPTTERDENAGIARAFSQHESNVPVIGSGTVSRVLADDNDGSRHQRILVRLPDGQTVLLVHNIDIAPRVTGVRPGDEIRFQGEYVWNERGGLVHWTHHDPAGRHKTGSITYAGRTYR